MTDSQVAEIIKEYHVPPHVRKHCEGVAKFALELAERLIARGEKINVDLVRQAALLHDFVRVIDFKEYNPETFPYPVNEEDIKYCKELRKKYANLHHAIAGAQILKERGFPDVAEIVRKHRFLQIEEGFDTWEEKIVYYADKRVKHETVVTLQERLDDGRKRYPHEAKNEDERLRIAKKVFELEKEIFTKIGETP